MPSPGTRKTRARTGHVMGLEREDEFGSDGALFVFARSKEAIMIGRIITIFQARFHCGSELVSRGECCGI